MIQGRSLRYTIVLFNYCMNGVHTIVSEANGLVSYIIYNNFMIQFIYVKYMIQGRLLCYTIVLFNYCMNDVHTIVSEANGRVSYIIHLFDNNNIYFVLLHFFLAYI